MVKFIIIRHGLSAANKEKKFAGQMDTPLDEIGVLQAENAAEYVANNFKVDMIYSSDLSRAFETARPLAEKLGMTVNKCKELREVDVGIWQGMYIEDVKKLYPDMFESYRQSPGTTKFINGESYADVKERVIGFIAETAAENDGKTIAIATHGGVIRNLRAAWNNIPLEKIGEIPHVPNASVSVADYENGKITWHLIGYNEHLDNDVTEEGVK